jgi:hypothetical protein
MENQDEIFSGIRDLRLTKAQLNAFAKQNLKDDFIYNQLIFYLVNSAGETITYKEAAKIFDKIKQVREKGVKNVFCN